MKKVLKQILTLSLIFIMVLSALPVQAANSESSLTKQIVTLYPGKSNKITLFNSRYLNLGNIDTRNNSVSVTVRNPAIAKVEANNSGVFAYPKKVGKTLVTVKAGNITRKCALTVKEYVNPVTSVKVGNTTISGKKFDTDPYRVISYSKFANKKAKVTFNLKKGWSFQYDAISYFQKTWQKSEDVKNGSIVPIKGGSGFQIMTAVVNDKTGQVEHLLLWFK